MSEEKKDEISNEKGEEQNYRRRSDGESGDEWNRAQDRRYLDEFEKIFSEGDEREGAGRNNAVEESVSKDGDSEKSEYEGYEEW
jgi:hypothetical protein